MIFSAIWNAFEIHDFWESGMTTDMSQFGCSSFRVLYQGKMNGDAEATMREDSLIEDLVGPKISQRK